MLNRRIHSPLFEIGITVAVVFGVCAVAFDSTGTFLDSRCRTTPIEVLFITFTNPPCVWSAICKKKKQEVTNKYTQPHMVDEI